MAEKGGIDRKTSGAVNTTTTGTVAPRFGTPKVAGVLKTASVTGAPGAGTFYRGGVSYAADGAINTTTDAIATTRRGVALSASGVIVTTTNAPSSSSRVAHINTVGEVLVDQFGRLHV